MNKPRVLILGATGFVGSSLTRRLLAENYPLILAIRNKEKALQQFPNAELWFCDFLKEVNVDEWTERLKKVDILINCVGLFFHPSKKVMMAAHYETPKALFQAA